MKKRAVWLDVVRIFAFLCILVIHFNASISGFDSYGVFKFSNSLVPNFYSNVYLGDIGSGLFFIISGASLEIANYPIKIQPNYLRAYYKKRFLAIFPMYWISFLLASVVTHTRFIQPIKCFIVSLFAMDGYLATLGLGKYAAYYKLGEWFLGCLLLLYLVYPFLSFFLTKKPLLTTLSVLGCYYCFIGKLSNITFIFQLPYLLIGMLFVHYGEKHKNRWIILALTAVIIKFTSIIELDSWSNAILLNLIIFVFMAIIFKDLNISNPQTVGNLMNASKMTYPVFLVHHIIITIICSRYLSLQTLIRSDVLLIFYFYISISIISAFLVLRLNWVLKITINMLKKFFADEE